MGLSQSISETVRRSVLVWFNQWGRDLPWRKTRQWYPILVSEIMLQQTQVRRVLPYYHAFLKRFPTPGDLAKASVADVIRIWGGLGYNKRALYLQQATRAIIHLHAGKLPAESSDLLALSGIGDYTASALRCFVHGIDVPVLDTNVKRVLGRVIWGSRLVGPTEMFNLASRLVPTGESWEWNQGLMDIGSAFCLPKNPKCPLCPLHECCNASPDFSAWKSGAKERPVMSTVKPRRFQDTTRYIRGKVLTHLRLLPPNSTIGVLDLGQQITPEFTKIDLPWFQRLLGQLNEDGLIGFFETADGQQVSLPV